MKPLLVSLLVLSAPAGFAALQPAPSQAPQPALSGSDYEELLEEFELTLEDWRAELRKADADGRKSLRASHPVRDFYPRFEELSKEGDGRALLWMAGNARTYHGSAKKSRPAKERLYLTLVTKHASEEWAGELVVSLGRQKSYLGEETVRAHLLTIGNTSERDEVAASALFALAKRLNRGSDEDRQRAEAVWDRIVRDFADSEFAAQVVYARSAHLYKVGAQPPDFTTQDADGVEFKLTDYRGKVVMLDFWGFW